MKPKILIIVEGGLISIVATTLPDCEVIIIDFDPYTQDHLPVLVSLPHEQDTSFVDGEAHLLFDTNQVDGAAAAEELKNLKY
jgi:hypothetical protein